MTEHLDDVEDRYWSRTTRSPGIARTPAAVRFAVAAWLIAIGLGAAEALVRTGLPDPPTPLQLTVRFAIYAVLTAIVLALPSGRGSVRRAARWAVIVLLGVLGTLSLVTEPVAWLVAGGSPAAYLADADGPTLLIVALRVVHVAAVLAALVAMFRPAARAFVRGPRRPRVAAGATRP